MKKNHYLIELEIPNTQKRYGTQNSRKQVKKIQSWLTLYEYSNPGSGTATLIDGDFGPATALAVKNFQSAIGKSRTGVVSKALFNIMSNPLHSAFHQNNAISDIRDRIAELGRQHLLQQPRELEINGESNMGPWVRSYMDNHNGIDWFWCVGFLQAIIDQALSEIDIDFRTYMPLTYSCDDLGSHAHDNGQLIRMATWRANPDLAKVGDIFLIRHTYWDWIHAGIILNVLPDDGLIETIEGNTNDDGSRNGYGVFQRIRNFQQSKIDLYSLQYIIDDLN